MWIKKAWKREYKLKGKSIKQEEEQSLNEINVNVELREDGLWLERQQLKKEWREIWKKLKRLIKGKSNSCKLKRLKDKRCKVKCMKAR